MGLPTEGVTMKNTLGMPSICVGYCACGCLAYVIYCVVASFQKCCCEGRYHGDGVSIKICHLHKAVVGVEVNARWK